MGKDLHLTPEQSSQITRSAFALNDPETFTARVCQRLETEPEIGEGLIFRICRSVQRELWAPPSDAAETGPRRAQPLRKINGRG